MKKKEFVRVEIDVLKTGQNLKLKRKLIGLKVKEVADLIGVIPRAIYKQEEGKALANVDNLLNLSRLYETSIEDLLAIKK